MAQTTNEVWVKSLGLPADTITKLQTAEGEEFQLVKNSFLTKLFNKITKVVIDNLDADNPFAKYYGEPIRYGDTIENIWVNEAEGYDFFNNPNKVESGGSPFKKNKPSVETLYATLNFTMQYKVTIEDVELRRATYNAYGFDSLISKILASLPTAGTLDRYFATIAMLANENIYAEGIQAIPATADTIGKVATETLVNYGTNMFFPNRTNNKLQVKQRTPKNRLVLVIKQSILNKINLDYLAGIYNLDKVDLIKNIITVESFSVEYKSASGEVMKTPDNIDFVLLDEKGFDIHNALESSGILYNPEELYTNHYYNLWDIIAYKYFYNARAFKLNIA